MNYDLAYEYDKHEMRRGSGGISKGRRSDAQHKAIVRSAQWKPGQFVILGVQFASQVRSHKYICIVAHDDSKPNKYLVAHYEGGRKRYTWVSRIELVYVAINETGEQVVYS